MFARTRRLTLRPGWPEDAAVLAKLVAPGAVAPPGSGDGAERVELLICAHEGGTPRLIGAIALAPQSESHELAFWLIPDTWGRGYATEAAQAVVEMARHALPIRRLSATCAAGDTASARVLRKLGFRDTGARRVDGPVVFELEVDCQPTTMPIAA